MFYLKSELNQFFLFVTTETQLSNDDTQEQTDAEAEVSFSAKYSNFGLI